MSLGSPMPRDAGKLETISSSDGNDHGFVLPRYFTFGPYFAFDLA